MPFEKLSAFGLRSSTLKNSPSSVTLKREGWGWAMEVRGEEK